MIEAALDFSIGFLCAALLGLLFVSLLHRRAVRLAVRRIISATPYSSDEIRADKDQLRAKLAMSTRDLEMGVAAMKAKTMSRLAELGQKTDVISQLKNAIGEKTAMISALESRNKSLQQQLLAAEEEFEIRVSALREAESVIADKEAELVRLVTELGEHSTIANRQRAEIAALRTEAEAIKASVTDYEVALKETVLRLAHDEEEGESPWMDLAEPRDEFVGLGARRGRRS